MTDNKFEVFISHTAQDAEIARLIRKIAESVGLTVWREWSMPPGSNFMDGMLSALEQASIAVILVGQRSSENQWLRHEREHIEELITKGNQIKPIVIILPGADTDAVNHFRDIAYLDLRSIATSPDVLSGLWVAFRLAATSLGKKPIPDSSSFQELVISLGERLYEDGKHEEAMAFLDQALAPFTADSTHKKNIHGELGVVNGMLKFANDYLRSSTQEENIRAAVEETAVLLGNVARKMFAQGDFPRARIIQVKLLSLLRGNVAENNQVFLTSMSNLANTLLAQGELISARDLQEKVLDIRRREFGTDAPNTLNSMNNLAETLRAQGDLTDARALQEQVLEIRSRVLGAEHPDTLTSMNNLASTLSSQGDLAGARALHEQELEICRRVLGVEHPDTLTSMNNLASTLSSQGDLPGAHALQEQELEICRRVLGAEHPDTLSSINNLAATLRSQGDLSGAHVLQEHVLEIQRRVLGAEHPDTLSSMNNLAATLSSQGDLTGARALQEQAFEIRRRVLGAEHPDTLTSMGNLALTLSSQGDLPGARALQEPALEIRRRLLGAEHPDTSISAFNLFATLLQSAGADEQALEIYREHLAWLLQRNPASLGAYQRTIRERLNDYFPTPPQ